MIVSLRRFLCAVTLAFAALVHMPAWAAELEPLAIETADGGTLKFDVEVMRTDADRMRGLMFRRDLPPDRGMLFEFPGKEPIQMWMKNTYLPLDMIFFRDGRVLSIAENTEPLSERIISSAGNATQVIEVNAGTAQRLKIKVGDRLIFPVTKR